MFVCDRGLAGSHRHKPPGSRRVRRAREVMVNDGVRDRESVGVLVLDPGTGADLPGNWPALAQYVQVLWLWLSAAEDPLVHARAMMERQADADRSIYVITRSPLLQTALLVAAHRPERVGAVLLVEEKGAKPGRDDLWDVLARHDVPVHSVTLAEPSCGRPHPLCRDEVMDMVHSDLIDLGVPAVD